VNTGIICTENIHIIIPNEAELAASEAKAIRMPVKPAAAEEESLLKNDA